MPCPASDCHIASHLFHLDYTRIGSNKGKTPEHKQAFVPSRRRKLYPETLRFCICKRYCGGHCSWRPEPSELQETARGSRRSRSSSSSIRYCKRQPQKQLFDTTHTTTAPHACLVLMSSVGCLRVHRDGGAPSAAQREFLYLDPLIIGTR